MPGIERVSTENLLRDLEADSALGIDKIILFGVPERKDEAATGAFARDGVVQKAVREIKKHFPVAIVI